MLALLIAVLPATVAGVAAGPWIQTHIQVYAGPPSLVRSAGVTAAILGVLAWCLDDAGTLLAYSWVGVFGVVLGFVDAATHRLPDRLTLTLYLGLLVLLTPDRQWSTFGRAVLGGLAMAVFYAALVLLNPAGMGPGDAKLALGLGTALGWLGWWPVFLGTLAAFVLAAGFALTQVARGRLGRRDAVAHGPFMLLGALATVVLISG
jgi:leader peptidase (prepilin peptidase) / N-methyltransferase